MNWTNILRRFGLLKEADIGYSKHENPEKGIDYDFATALGSNPQSDFTITDIEKVLAFHPGEAGYTEWVWVVALADGRFAWLQGGTDFSGWDCQNYLESKVVDSPLEAVELVRFESDELKLNVKTSLTQQLRDGKNRSWRDDIKKEFGL